MEEEKKTDKGTITSDEDIVKNYEFEQKKENSNTTYNEFRDCIICHGEFQNTILNKGKIKGNIFQEAGKTEEDKTYDFSKEKDIVDFIEAKKASKELLDFLCITFLEIIPLALLSEIRDCMEYILYKGDSLIKNDYFGNLNKELEILGIQKVEVLKQRKEPIEALMFNEGISVKNIRHVIWEQYRSLRSPLLKWLMELKRKEKVAKLLFYQIQDVFVELSTYDFFYTKTEIFLYLRESGSYSDRNIMVKIIKQYISNNQYDEMLDQYLMEKDYEKDVFWWQVIYRLYQEKKEYRFQKLAEDRMLKLMRHDLKLFQLDERKQCWDDENLDFYPAYYDKDVEQLFVKTIYKIYLECLKTQEKIQFSYYFCWLIREDFRKEGYPWYKLMMFQCLQDREIRTCIREMYIELWRKRKFRKIIGRILKQHFIELEYRKIPWNYLKDFFKTVAFTGREEDFKDTIYFFKKEKNSKTSKEVCDWLESILKVRM